MRIAIFLLLVGFLQTQATDTYSQNTKLSISFKNIELVKVLDKIENQSEFYFLYNEKLIDATRKVSIEAREARIEDVLKSLFSGTDVEYSIVDRKIILAPAYLSESQQPGKKVTGKVTDSSGGSLPGVSVVVKGTTTGIVTDNNGSFSLTNIPENATLQFSFVGMKSQEVVVRGKSSINIKLEEETLGIEEVVAIGFGTQKKTDIIGSIATVKGDEIVKLKATNVAESLQGLASGLMVTNSSGHPGNPPDIKIRGINSISLSSEPLWIIDGMPIYTGSSENIRDGVKPVSAISMFNPNDIKSIEVLKDASATAIYGSRGSGGVILVTTKSAGQGKTALSLNYDGGYSQIPFSQNDIFVDSKTWWALSDLAAKNLGIVPTTPNSIISTVIIGDQPQMTKEEAIATNTDQLKALTKDAIFHQFGFTANKGFETGGVMFSLSYRDEKGLIRNNDFKRLTSRFSFNFNPVKSLELGINSDFIYLKTNGVRSQGGKAAGGWANWETTMPWLPIYDKTSPTGYWSAGSGYNLMANSDRALQRYDVDQYRGIFNSHVQWTPLEGLIVRGQVGVDLLVNNSSFFRSSLLNPTAPHYSNAEEKSVTQYIANYNVYSNYTKLFNDIHFVDFTIGTEANSDWSYKRQFAGSGLQTAYPELINPLQMNYMIGSQGGNSSLMGFFARANYKLLDRYLFNASTRRDGHSAFNKDNRWANFYALGAGWIATNENFLKGISFLNLLKLRGSLGTTGNTKVSNAMTYMQWRLDQNYIFGVNVPAGSTTIGPLGSQGLKWETTTNIDVGSLVSINLC